MRTIIDEGLGERQREVYQHVRKNFLLHDVGKMKIPAAILNKPGRLTPEEMEVMQLHPVYGHEIVKGRVPGGAAQIVLNHHQRYNGGGYPGRIDSVTGTKMPPLSGKQIPLYPDLHISTIDITDVCTFLPVQESSSQAAAVPALA